MVVTVVSPVTFKDPILSPEAVTKFTRFVMPDTVTSFPAIVYALIFKEDGFAANTEVGSPAKGGLY